MGRILQTLCFVVLVMISLHTNGVSSKCYDDQNSKPEFLPEPLIPDECLNQGYCEYVPNYPEELAAKLIAKLANLVNRNQNLDILSSSKINTYKHYETLCNVIKTKVTPKAAKDTNGRWHFILNQKNHIVQQYVEVKCMPDLNDSLNLQSCDSNQIYFSNAKGRCQQKEAVIVLKTINKFCDVQAKNFTVPCCCSCNAYTD